MLPSRDRQGAFFWARRQRSCFCYGRPSRGPFAIPTTFHTSTNSPAASRPESWWTPISIGGRIPNAWAGAYGSWARKRFPDRKSTRLNSSHLVISYAVFCLKKKRSHAGTRACRVRPCIAVGGGRHIVEHPCLSRPRCFFFFNDTATPEIYTLPLHAALPISVVEGEGRSTARRILIYSVALIPISLL